MNSERKINWRAALKLFTKRHGNQLRKKEREKRKNMKRLLTPNQKEVGHTRCSVIFRGHHEDSKGHCGDDAACIVRITQKYLRATAWIECTNNFLILNNI